MPTWQLTAEGLACAWPSYNLLLPTRYKIRGSCIPDVICSNEVVTMQTWGHAWGTLTMWQSGWCRVSSCLQSVKPPVEYRLFYKNCGASFQWLLVVCSEKCLWLLVASSLSTHPAFHTFSHTFHSRIIWQPLYNNYNKRLESLVLLFHDEWLMVYYWSYISSELYTILSLTLTLQFPSQPWMSVLIWRYFWTWSYYK